MNCSQQKQEKEMERLGGLRRNLQRSSVWEPNVNATANQTACGLIVVGKGSVANRLKLKKLTFTKNGHVKTTSILRDVAMQGAERKRKILFFDT
jgi:hypothetical protein